MSARIFQVVIVPLLASFAVSAEAGLISIEDTITATQLGSPGGVLLTAGGPSLSYTHDLNSAAWNPLTDTVIDGELTLSFLSGTGGFVFFTVDALPGGAFVGSFDFDQSVMGIQGLLQDDGMLSITLTATVGSVTFSQSKVQASISTAPEPGTLMLFGLGTGALGLRAVRRRSRKPCIG